VKQLRHVDKLANRSRVGVFIGYMEGAKAYHILDPVARQVCSARDVMFNEVHGWDWVATMGVPSMAEFTVEYIYVRNLEAAVAVRLASPRPLSSPPPSVRMSASPPFTPVTVLSPQSVVGPEVLRQPRWSL
jgi:hypothetical protein